MSGENEALAKISEWLAKFGEKVDRNGRLLETAFEVLEEVRDELKVQRHAIASLSDEVERLKAVAPRHLRSRLLPGEQPEQIAAEARGNKGQTGG